MFWEIKHLTIAQCANIEFRTIYIVHHPPAIIKLMHEIDDEMNSIQNNEIPSSFSLFSLSYFLLIISRLVILPLILNSRMQLLMHI